MFQHAKLTFGSNIALAQLGVNTQRLNSTWRRGCQAIAIAQKMSAKELAVSMLFQLPVSEVDWQLAESVIEKWVEDGSIQGAFVVEAKLMSKVPPADSNS